MSEWWSKIWRVRGGGEDQRVSSGGRRNTVSPETEKRWRWVQMQMRWCKSGGTNLQVSLSQSSSQERNTWRQYRGNMGSPKTYLRRGCIDRLGFLCRGDFEGPSWLLPFTFLFPKTHGHCMLKGLFNFIIQFSFLNLVLHFFLKPLLTIRKVQNAKSTGF